MTMRIRRPLLAFLIFLALLTAGGIYAANSDAHGWHWTKCRLGRMWVRGHQGVNWYNVTSCKGTWEMWVNWPSTAPVWKSAKP